MLSEFNLIDDPVAVMHEISDEPVLLRTERDRLAQSRDPHLPCVERDFADFDHRPGVAGRAADQRAQPRYQFLHPERLGKVVVGSRVDPLDPLVPVAATCKD